jgi:hypothetical protein
MLIISFAISLAIGRGACAEPNANSAADAWLSNTIKGTYFIFEAGYLPRGGRLQRVSFTTEIACICDKDLNSLLLSADTHFLEIIQGRISLSLRGVTD